MTIALKVSSKSRILCSALIIELIQRHEGFERYFTRDNVALLTEAAGLEESMVKV